jgi:hypothetical protein
MSTPETTGYRLDASFEPPLLQVTVTGGEETGLPVSLEYWQRIAVLVRETGARQLLVLDRMQGEVMSDEQLARFFDQLGGSGLEQVRIAYVEGRVDQIQRIEYAELMALERGYDIRMFANESDARLWLRHGGS